MAATTSTKHSFYVVDLIRKKPKLEYIELPAYRVDVDYTVTVKGKKPAPSTAIDRLKEAGMAELERYEKVIGEEAVKLDKKIGILMKEPTPANVKKAEALIQGTNQSIMNALKSAEGAAQVAIAKRLAMEAKGDALLKEAQVKVGLKVAKGVIKIGAAVARLVATSGADASAYYAIAKQCYDFGKMIEQAMKDDEKLRKDLTDGLNAFLKLRETELFQAAKRQGLTDSKEILKGISFKSPGKAVTELKKRLSTKTSAAYTEVAKKKSPEKVFKIFLDGAMKGIIAKQKDVDGKRKIYREHTTKTRQKTDKLGTSADELMKKAKTADLKQGIKLGAEAMNLKRQASEFGKKLADREKFLEEIKALMAANDLSVDDKTIMEKIKKLDAKTLLTEGANVASLAKGVYKLADEIRQVAA